jgi:hypothetical protein
VVVVEHATGVSEIQVVVGGRVPGERQDPVDVRADHPVLGRGGRQPAQPVELAADGAVGLLGQRRLVHALAQLGDLRRLLVGLAELLLDRAQLLAQEVLPLALVDLGRDLRLDLRAELEHLQLASDDRRDAAEPLFGVDLLEERLPVVERHPHRGGDHVREEAGVVDALDRRHELGRERRRELHDPRELPEHVPYQRLHRRRVLDRRVRHRLELAAEVRLGLRDAEDADALDALHQEPQGAVRHAHHPVHLGGDPDLVQVVRPRLLHRRVADGDEEEPAVADEDVVDQAHRSLLPHRERLHGLREDDGVLERQERQAHRSTSTTTTRARRRGVAAGSETVR